VLASVMLLSLLASCHTPQESGSQTESETEWAPAPNPASDFEYGLTVGGETIAITKYIGTETTVVLPSEIEGKPVTWIGMEFDPNDVIESLYIPASLENIDSQAFMCNESLRVLRFEERDRPIKIWQDAFYECPNLEKLELPAYTVLYGGAFRFCPGIKEIFIPNTVEFEQYAPFTGLQSLEKVVLEDGITALDVDTLFVRPSSLKSITIPASVTEMDCAVFRLSYALESIMFLGDAPALVTTDPWKETVELYSNDDPLLNYDYEHISDRVIIYYDPATKGWDTFAYDTEAYILVPLPAAES